MDLLKNRRVGTSVVAVAVAGTALGFAGSALAQSVNFEQIRNGQASSVSVPTVSWVNGNANATQAHFLEGHSTSYRLLITGLTPGNNYWITMSYDTKRSGKSCYDFITHYDRLEPHAGAFAHCCAEDIDPLAGLVGTFSGPSTFPIPAPQNGGWVVAPTQPTDAFNALPANERLATIYNGTLTNISYTQQDSLVGDDTISKIRFDFTASASTVVIAFGGHISTQFTWGEGNTPASIPGSSYHIRIDSASFGASGQTLQLMASAVYFPPDCTIAGPDAICPGATQTYEGPPAAAGQTYDWTITGCATFDGGGTTADTQSVDVVACDDCGSFQLNLTVTKDGQETSCSKTVSVEVDTPINIVSCPPNPAPVSCTGSIPAAYTTVAQFVAAGGVISDTCGDLSISHIDTPLAGTCGTITRTYTITDACGNTDTCQQTITVNDNVGPVLTGCPAQTVVNITCASQIPAVPNVTANDNCDGSIDVDLDVTDVGTGCGANTRVITRTWSASDNCGNTSTCTQTINILDNTPPVLTGCPTAGNQNINVQCASQIPAPPSVTANDNCAGSITPVFNESNNGGTGCVASPRIITRTWTATDPCGNSAQCSQTITIIDNTVPVLTGCPTGGNANVSIQCPSQIPAPPTVTATDNCAGTLTVNLQTNDVGSGCPASPRVITRTWTATDPCGNSASCQQVITIIDNTQPVLSGCPVSVVNVQCPSQIPAPANVTATDNCAGNITPVFNQTDNGGSGCVASPLIITRTWTATDSCGNTRQCTQTINVIDTTDPIITCPPDVDVECGDAASEPAETVEEFIAQGGEISDNCGVVTITWLGDEQISEGAECPLTFERTYEAADSCGNTAQCVQIIQLIDTSPPVQCCVVPELIGCVGFPITVPAPVVTDECGLTITPVAIRSDGLAITDPFPLGETTVTWTSTDGCGNESDDIVVTVIMNQCPTYRTKAQDGWAGASNTLIASLLGAPAGGDILIGRTDSPARSMTIAEAAAGCVKSRLPASGTNAPFPSNFGNQVLDSGSCNTSTPLPLNGDNKFESTLLGNTIAMALNLRFDEKSCDGGLGDLQLCSVMTTIKSNGVTKSYVIPESVLVALGGNRTVDDLLALANTALAGRPTVPASRASINTALTRVNNMFSHSQCVALVSTSCDDLPTAPMNLAQSDTASIDTAPDQTDPAGTNDPDAGTGRDGGNKTGSINSGVLTPSLTEGVTTVDGDFTQTETGTLIIQLHGPDSPTRCDLLEVNGDAYLRGTLVVDTTDDFAPMVGEMFEVVTADTIHGEFEHLLLADLDGDAYLDIRYTPASVVVDVKTVPVIGGDLDRNGLVDTADLLMMLREWGSAKPAFDLTGDGTVNAADLISLLGNWGSHSLTGQ